MPADESWAPVARDTREALKLLGYPIVPRCLLDEPEACGASFTQHAAAHLATIKAIADHQLDHLGPDFAHIHGDIYWHAREKLAHR